MTVQDLRFSFTDKKGLHVFKSPLEAQKAALLSRSEISTISVHDLYQVLGVTLTEQLWDKNNFSMTIEI